MLKERNRQREGTYPFTAVRDALHEMATYSPRPERQEGISHEKSQKKSCLSRTNNMGQGPEAEKNSAHTKSLEKQVDREEKGRVDAAEVKRNQLFHKSSLYLVLQ